MNAKKLLIGISSLLFIMISVDKFFPFLDPPCSLMGSIPPMIWKVFGALQFVAGILIWFPKYTKYVAGFFSLFMLFFTMYHLVSNTYDVGGSAFMAVVLGIIYWDPKFISGK